MTFATMWRLTFAVLATLLCVSPSRAQEAGPAGATPEVRLTVTARMEDGRPVGAAESFPSDVGEIYAVVDVVDARGETFWIVFGFLGSESMVEIHVREDPAREWTAMAIPSEATGQWSVAVVHDGETLATRMFTVESR
jgi:hypothetical protein